VTRRREQRLVAAAVLIGLGLRLAWGIWVSREPTGLYDPARYLGMAREIAKGHGMVEPMSGHPTAYYPPGYPWFLGIVAWLSKPFTDDVPLVAALVQSVIGAATALLGAVVARRLAGPRAAVAAAFGLALYPNLVFHSGTLLGETLYNGLFLGFLVVLLRGGLGPADTRRVAVAGLLLGLAVMVRPISLAIVPVVIGCWWLGHPGRRTLLRGSAVLVGAVALCIVPWTVRNAVRMHELVPLSTNTGDNLCLGHAKGANGAFSARHACDTSYNFLDGPADEVAADREKTRIAVRAVLDDPGREPWLLWRRFWFMWIRDGDHDGVLAAQSYRLDRFLARPTERRLTDTADVAYWAVCATGLAGAVVLVRRRRPEDLLLVGSAVMTALVPLAFFGDSRFKVPVIPLLIIMAATLVGDHGALPDEGPD
jgi:hypothetical protein